MSSALFLAIAIPIGLLLCAAAYWLNFLLQLWVVDFFMENRLRQYVAIGLFTGFASIAAQPFAFFLVGLPVLLLMAWRDPRVNLQG